MLLNKAISNILIYITISENFKNFICSIDHTREGLNE